MKVPGLSTGVATGITLCVLLAFSLHSAAAQQPSPSLTINQFDSSTYPTLTAVVTALNGQGVPVPNLAPAAFRAYEANTPLTIQKVETEQDSSLRLSVALLIDVSGSMNGKPLDAAKQAATDFVRSLGPNDEAAVFAFSGNVTQVVPFTGDRDRLAAGIASLQASGYTALYEALGAGVHAASGAATPRKAIVLLTDGQEALDPNAPPSQASAASSIDAAKASGVPVFTVGFGTEPDVAYLQSLSTATEGVYYAASTGTVVDVYHQLAALLRSQYRLTMNDGAKADGRSATIRIVAALGGTEASAVRSFVRPAPPAIPTAVPTIAATAPAGATGGSHAMLFVLIAIAAAVAVVLILVVLRRMRAARVQRRRERVAGHLSEEDLPSPIAGTGPSRDPREFRAQIVALNDGEAVYEFGARPLVIGSGPRAGVQLPAAIDIAPEHATIWVRDGKIMLRHVGGPRRATLVGARPIAWVVMEQGDEFSVGSHRYRVQADSAS